MVVRMRDVALGPFFFMRGYFIYIKLVRSCEWILYVYVPKERKAVLRSCPMYEIDLNDTHTHTLTHLHVCIGLKSLAY